MDSKKTRTIVAVAVAAVLVIAAAVAAYLFLGGEEPIVQVSSPWPQAEAERSVPKPAEPPVWPLTGMPAPTADAPASIRVVSVKIENSPAARPQSGIQAADVVYESITEGGITRFNCMFHSNNPAELVGPVRSARLSDIDIVPQYSPLFVFSGASGVVNSAVRAAGLENLSQDVGVSNGYTRVSFRSAPHNLYLDLAEIREEGVSRGYSASQEIKPLAFDRSSADTPTVSHVTIPFSQANTAEWTYDPESDTYLRENNGRVHTDALTDEQISARNVVVVWARMVAQRKTDVTGSTTYDIELTGSGRATVFRNGAKLDCTWATNGDAPPTFTAADGSAVRLAPGNTWFQVIPTNLNISME